MKSEIQEIFMTTEQFYYCGSCGWKGTDYIMEEPNNRLLCPSCDNKVYPIVEV